MKNAIKLVKNINLSKPELVLRSIPRHGEISAFTTKYKKFLNELPKSIRKEETRNLIRFPYRSFNLMPKDVLTKIIDESFQIIKQKVESANYPALYNATMKTYLSNEISFDSSALLKEMNDNNVQFNEETYHILIALYCNCGDMGTVEYLINTMTKEKIAIEKQDKLRIITGYIIAGQASKSKSYIKENGLVEDDLNVLISEGKGYATLGDTSNVMLIINKMKETNMEFVPTILDFYRRLLTADAPESELEQILQLIPPAESNFRLLDLVFHLNRAGYYNKSLKLLENHTAKLSEVDASALVTSFNSKECPVNTYKTVLILLMEHLTVSQKNLFSHMDYDDAVRFSRTIINDQNGNVIFTSLQNKAISEKSVTSLQDALQFGIDNLRMTKLNLQLQYGFIPSILQSGMVANCKEILDLVPQYKAVLIAPILMYNLCKGNFSEYDSLLSYGGLYSRLYYKTNFKTVALEILNNISIQELEKISVEASKIFDTVVVNNILANVIIEAIVMQSGSDSRNRISEIVALAEKCNVTFKTIDIEKLKKQAPEHIELYQSFSKRILDVKSRNKISGTQTDVPVENL